MKIIWLICILGKGKNSGFGLRAVNFKFFCRIDNILGLLILGVDYSLIFGNYGGTFRNGAFVGPFLTGTMAFLIAISQSWTLGFYTIALFSEFSNLKVIFNTSSYAQTIGLHPVVAVISLLAGSQIAGFVGIILAVPIAVVIQEIIEDWDLRKNSHIHA